MTRKTKISKRTKVIVGIAIAVVVLAIASFFFFNNKDTVQTMTVKRDTLVRSVSVTGEVVPVDEVTLAFTAGGRVASLPIVDGQRVTRGAILASLDAGEVQANLRQAIADKAVADAELSALVGSSSTQGKITATKQQALTAITKAFSVADTQVLTNVDALFDDPKTGRPEITRAISNFFARQAIGEERVTIGELLETWGADVASLKVNAVTEKTLATTYQNLLSVRTYLTNISTALSDAEPTNQITEINISTYRSTIATARAAVDGALTDITTAQDALRAVIAENPVQNAKVSSSAASIDRYNALLQNYALTAPFNGVVADVMVTQGEVVAMNQDVVSLVSDGTVELEVFIPEVNIAFINVGDTAKVKLDAFGDTMEFDAAITFVDTKATSKNGIVTYRTKLAFNQVPPEVRPGMTATIVIEAVTTPDVLLIPQASIKTINGVSFVDVLVGDTKERRQVTLGMTDTRGGVTVEAGLVEGDRIITGE
jgi:HlyD family secretion protein